MLERAISEMLLYGCFAPIMERALSRIWEC